LFLRFPELATITEYFSKAKEVTTSALASLASSLGAPSMVEKLNTNYRLVDYQAGSGSCQPHRDFGLLTLIEGSGVSGLEVEVAGKLVPVPAHTSVLLAGWCLHLVSNGRVPAPLHRVTSPPSRRQATVTFLAPTKETVLEPLVVAGEAGPLYRSVGVRELKEMMAKRWRWREGTLTPHNEEVETSQDEFVFKQLRI
jgi:isopenicillin N synthase-like dioxygenase